MCKPHSGIACNRRSLCRLLVVRKVPTHGKCSHEHVCLFTECKGFEGNTCPRVQYLLALLPKLTVHEAMCVCLSQAQVSFALLTSFASLLAVRVMPSGVVKKWFDEQGYGFIAPVYGRSDVFVHRRGLLGGTYLNVGQPVVYEVEYSSEKGGGSQ